MCVLLTTRKLAWYVLTFMLSCACLNGYAQDSFANPYSFKYNIEFSSELENDTLAATTGRLTVNYDTEQHSAFCTIMYANHVRYEGRIVDMQLYQDKQTFRLDAFFAPNQCADLVIIKNADVSDQKVALIYASGTDAKRADNCICLLLTDVAIKPKLKDE